MTGHGVRQHCVHSQTAVSMYVCQLLLTCAKLRWSAARRLEDSSFRMLCRAKYTRRVVSTLPACSLLVSSSKSVGQSLG